MTSNKVTLKNIIENLSKENINFLDFFKFLSKKTVKKINKAMKNKYKYVVFIYLDENLKSKYNKNLLKKTLNSIEKKLNISKENIIIIYFSEIRTIISGYSGYVETPLYIFFEKNIKLKKDFEIKYLGYETGYLV